MSSRHQEQWIRMLGHLADRDGAVELSRGVDGDDAATISYRSRVFHFFKDGSTLIETPQQAVRDRAFRVGDDLDLTVMVNGERMIATCTLKEVLTHAVNASLKVTCYRLSPGRRPVREQRRSFFRVNVAAMDLEQAVLCSEIEDEDTFECKGQLVNLSGGGMGVSIRAVREVLGRIKRTRAFTCRFSLDEEPGDDAWVRVPVQVAHISVLGEDGLYLGLRFDFEDEAGAKAHEQWMQQRCTEIERMQLRRRRA